MQKTDGRWHCSTGVGVPAKSPDFVGWHGTLTRFSRDPTYRLRRLAA